MGRGEDMCPDYYRRRLIPLHASATVTVDMVASAAISGQTVSKALVLIVRLMTCNFAAMIRDLNAA